VRRIVPEPGTAVVRIRRRPKTLKAGTYKVAIHDKASIHGCSLDGPHGFAKDIIRCRSSARRPSP